jgi:hypothetical protein
LCRHQSAAKLAAMRTRSLALVKLVAAALLVAAFALTGSARAVTVTGFSVAPSTTQAGGHPNLLVTLALSEPVALSGLALHLPPGLGAEPRAIPFCPRKSLSADFCPRSSRVGSIAIVAVAYGFELPVTRKIYNARPGSAERLRFGVPIIPSYSGRGVVVELPVTERPDKGLDIAVAGLPNEVGGIPVRLKKVTVSIKGVSRRRIKKRIRKRAFLTNPTSCVAATSTLDVALQDAPTSPLTASSSFTPSGCTSPTP